MQLTSGSGRNSEAVVLDQLAAVGLQIILNEPDPCHGGGDAGSTVSEIPVMGEQLPDIHDLDLGGLGFPELALLQNWKRGG